MQSGPKGITRRTAAKMLAGSLLYERAKPVLALAAPRAQNTLSQEEDTFLDEMERSACLYFYEQADPGTGQVLDRAVNRTSTGERDRRFVSSIAATGFG